MENNAVALASLGVLATSVGAMAWVTKYALTKSGRDLQAHTNATKSLEAYLKERNGRDAEQHKRSIEVQKKLIKAVNDLPSVIQTIADGAADRVIHEQTVKEQNVGLQHIGKQEFAK